MWEKLKPTINKLVLFSIKTHWSLLIVLAVFQYWTGRYMSFYSELPLYRWHALGGKLFLAVAILLTLEKLYLLLK